MLFLLQQREHDVVETMGQCKFDQLEREWQGLVPEPRNTRLHQPLDYVLEFDLGVRAQLRSQAMTLVSKGWEREKVALALAELAEELVS